jgi:hypothetical protein
LDNQKQVGGVVWCNSHAKVAFLASDGEIYWADPRKEFENLKEGTVVAITLRMDKWRKFKVGKVVPHQEAIE